MSEPTFQIGVPGGISATILPYGATLHALYVPDAARRVANVLGGPSDPALHRAGRHYVGATVGRFANRIAGARFELDGTTHRLRANEGGTCLHGGPDGFDRRDWQVLSLTDRKLVLGLASPDGDQGFPGALSVRADFKITAPMVLEIRYRATCTAACPVSISSHGAFNLSGGGPVADHRLRLAAGRYLPTDAMNLPGAPRPVAGSRFDFRRERPVLAPGDPGFDHCLCTDGTGLRPVAWLSDPASGRALRLESDHPGLQLFTCNADTPGLPAQHALCLEPQHWPDAPNRPDFPDAVLRPGESYAHTIRYVFSNPPEAE